MADGAMNAGAVSWLFPGKLRETFLVLMQHDADSF
jgi:hypothetical protein